MDSKVKGTIIIFQVNDYFKNVIFYNLPQTQAEFQQMELRIKDLESELSKMKNLQEDYNKAQLEKYKQLYLVECEVRKSLEDKLDKSKHRITETKFSSLICL